MMHPSGAARCPVIAAGLSQRAGASLDSHPCQAPGRWCRRRGGAQTPQAQDRLDARRLWIAVARVAYLARRKTRWDYSKCHKRRSQARRARFAPILDLRASLPKTGTDDTISSRRLTRIPQMLATLNERGDAHTQQHLQRWRMDDIWLDREPGEREMVPRLRAQDSRPGATR